MGPVPLSELQSLVAGTRVNNQELAWTAGMQDWAKVIDLPILRDPTFRRTAVGFLPAPTDEPAKNGDEVPSTLAPLLPATEMPAPPYVVPRTSLYGPVILPPRPAETFVDHAEPRGEASDWPLNDQRIMQFEIAGELRHNITAAASLYWIMMILTGICGIAMLVVSACLLMMLERVRNPAPGYLLFGGIFFAFAVIFYFAARFTRRSNRAAPATMMMFFGIVTIMNIAGVIGLLRQAPIDAVYCGIGGAFSIVFAVVSFRAFAAIPEFRQQPAWCQEVLIRAKL